MIQLTAEKQYANKLNQSVFMQVHIQEGLPSVCSKKP